jgi:acyl carrier protein
MTDERTALIAFLKSRDVLLPEGWDDDTSLIRSGILDSLGLLELILWLEQRLGRPLDPTALDLASELDSIRDILGFLARSVR